MKYKVIAFSGSVRKESYTTKLINAFKDHAPGHVMVEMVAIDNLPFINEDLEQELPEAVTNLYAMIEDADGVIFATPEYNRSYSPVLKNAIDWGSRPEGKNKWKQKPVAVIGCTPYSLGAFGAQNHLRQVLMYVDMIPLQQPEFYLANVAEKFDEKGKLYDDETRQKIKEVWKALFELMEHNKNKSTIMLQKMNADTNAINWFDIPVTDLERAKKFYETIFDITMETAEGDGAEMAFFPRIPKTTMGLSGILSGSLLKKKDFKPGENGPLIYLNASPVLQTVLDKVEKAGGKIVMDRTKIPAGFVATCIDTEGNRIGLHAAK